MENIMKITVTPKVSNLINCVSKDKTRINLDGVYLDKENKQAVATNGHIMAVTPLSRENIPSESVLMKFNKPFKNYETFECNGVAKAELNPANSCQYETNVKYPQWQQVIPGEPEEPISITFSVDYLVALAKTINGSTKGGITLTLDAKNLRKPIIVTNSSSTTKGYLMPMKTDIPTKDKAREINKLREETRKEESSITEES